MSRRAKEFSVGNTIWVEVEGRSKDDLPPDSSITLRLIKQLDELSDRLNVAKLSEFFDYSVVEDEFTEELAELERAAADENKSSVTWFDPARPLEAVRALHDQLSADFTALRWVPDRSRNHWPAALVDELKRCRRTLEEAQERRQQCRLLIPRATTYAPSFVRSEALLGECQPSMFHSSTRMASSSTGPCDFGSSGRKAVKSPRAGRNAQTL